MKIEFLLKDDDEKWKSLTKEEQEAIKEGLKELNEGKGISHEQVISELRKKYSS